MNPATPLSRPTTSHDRNASTATAASKLPSVNRTREDRKGAPGSGSVHRRGASGVLNLRNRSALCNKHARTRQNENNTVSDLLETEQGGHR